MVTPNAESPATTAPVTQCSECGAQHADGESCRACFEALLAFENERPPAFGAVHHLTVACYFLQHPAGYAPAALTAWRELLAEALDSRNGPSEFATRMRRRFDGAARVRESGAEPPSWWPRAWPMTVRDVLRPNEHPPSIEAYIDRAHRWAAETRAALAHARESDIGQESGIAKPTSARPR